MAEEKKPTKTILLLVVAGLVVLGIATAALRKKPVAVSVVTLTREDLSETISSNGKVEPVDATVAHAEFPTFVAKVMATEGQTVHRGQVILTLDATDLKAQLAQAQASLLAAQTELRNARAGGAPDEVAQVHGSLQQARVDVASLERSQKSLELLVAKHAATQDELAQNQASLEKARSNVQELEQKKEALAQRAVVGVQNANLMSAQAQEQVVSLEGKVRSATVIAPTDATLYSLPVRVGDYVKVGDVLAEMADLRKVRVRAFVDEPDLGRLQPNQPVQITWDAKPDRVWQGFTEQIPEQVVSHGMRSVGEVLCSVNNAKRELLPNINVEVTILLLDRPHALVIPRAAVREDDTQHYVFVFDGDKIHRRNISVGISNASKYEVLSGVAEGDRIALPGDRDLRDGMEIRPAEGT